MRWGRFPSCLLAHCERMAFRLSSGGVAAKRSSRFSLAISLPTNLALYLGASASPLFWSIHLVDMTFIQDSRFLFVYTPRCLKNTISSLRAVVASSLSSGAPLMSSTNSESR